jgi:serine/threonine protein kinase
LAKITVSPKGMQHIFDELGTSEKITQLKISYEQILKIREKQPAFTASDAFVTAYLHDIEVPKVHELFQKQIQEQGHYYHTEGDLPQGWRVRLQDTEFSVVTAHQLGKGTYNTCEIAVRFMKQKPPEYEVHRSSELRKEKYPAEKHDFQEEITIASIVSGKEQIVTMPFATLLTNGKDEFQMCMSLEPCGVRWGDTTSVDLDGILEKRDHVLQNPQTRRKELLQRLRVFRDYTKGVATLHQMGIVHFDLKPGNCLLKEDETGNIRGYVADFGTAMRRGPDGKFHKLNSILSEGHQTYSTPEYASPTLLYARGATGQLLTKEEMLEKINHDEIVPEKEDIWALGITLKELFDHQDFSWMTSIKEAVLEKSRIGHIRSKEEVSDHLEALPSKIKEVEAQIKKLLVQSMRKEGELRQKLQQKEALEDEMDIYILLNFMLQNDPQMRLSADALVPKIDEVIERMEERLNQEEPQELRKDESKQEI